MRNRMTKPIAWLLLVCMVMSLLPVTAIAATNLVPADGWTIVNEDDNLYINDTDTITITTTRGDFSKDANAGQADNYWLRTPADEDFVLTLKVSGGFNTNWQKAGIMVYKDDYTVASVVRRYHTGLNAAGNVLGMFQYTTRFDEPVIVDPDPDAPVYLKLEKAGDQFTGSYRFDETEEWTVLDTLTNPTVASYEDMKIGVFATNGSADNGLDVQLSEFTYNGEPVDFAVASDEAIAARAVNLDAQTLILDEGKSEVLTATVVPSYTTDKTVVWESSDEDVAVVEDGRVIAKGEGEAVITATCGSVSAECSVTVYGAITGVKMDMTEMTWESAKAFWADPAINKDVDGGTIDMDGKTYEKGISAHASSEIVYNIEGMGATYFLAEIGLDNDRGGEANFVVKADNVELYRVDKVTGTDAVIAARVAIPAGAKKLQLITESGDSTNNDHTIWANPQLVVASGEDVPVSSIELATESGRTSFSTSEGSVAIIADVAPVTAADTSVTWSVSPAGASIDESGILTVTKAGTYTVTATANDGSGVTGHIVLSFVDTNASWTVDTETKHNWIGTYGADGYVLCGWNDKVDVQSLPYYIDSVDYVYQDRSGGYVARKANSASDRGWDYALPLPEAPDGERRLSYQFDDKAMTVRITANDNYEHQLTFYCVAESENGRQQTVQLLDPRTGEPISDAVTMKTMSQGKYITIRFAGSVDVLFHNDVYSPLKTNVVVNGIFFDTQYEGDTIPVRDISITPDDGEVIRSELGKIQMNASIQPAAATDKSLKWTVDNAGVASVDDNGLVTIKKAGTFTVTAASVSNPETSDSVTMVVMDDAAAPEKAEVQLLGGSYAMIQNKLVRMIFDLESGYYSLYEQATGLPVVLNAYFQVNGEKSHNGYTFTAEEVDSDKGTNLRLTGVKEGADDLILEVGLEDATGDILMRTGITNNSGSGVKVMQMYPIVAKYNEKGGIFVGPNPDENHALLTGEGNWTVPQVKQGVTTTSKNNLILSYRNNPELATFLLGQLTTYSFQSTITTTYNANAALVNSGRSSIDADIRIFDNTGKLVDDGATYLGDVALLNFTTKDPYQSLDDYAWRQAEAMKVDLIDFDPYIYECLWYVNWYTPGSNNVEYALKEVDYLKEKGLANYAIPNLRVEPDTYVNPNEQLWWDDEHWLAFGHLSENYPTMGDWLDAMHEKGAEGGIYMQASYRSDDYCAQYPEHMIGNVAEGGPDYTDPGFQAHMAEVYTRLKEDGLKSLFFDYAGQYKGPGASYLLNLTGGFEDPYATTVEAYRMIYQLPKTYVGPEIRVSENSWEYSGSDLAIGLIDIQRNIGDTNEFNPDIATVALNQWYRHRKTKLLYSDVKVFENDNVDLRRAQITGTGFFFGKTTMGESVNRMSDEKIKDIGKIVPFPVDGIAARPVGLFEGDYDVNPEVMDYEFAGQYDDHILLFWNQTGSVAKEISADLGLDEPFGGIGLDENKTYEAWDFWNWQYVGEFDGADTLTQTVRANEMRTMAVREVREEPYLLSTNRHILQGTQEIDVKAFEYDADAKTIHATFDIVGNDTYKAIVSLAGQELVLAGFEQDNANVTGSAKQNAANGYIEIVLDAAENETVNVTLTLTSGSAAEDTKAPTEIRNLVATAEGTGYVTLTWDHSTDDSEFIQLSYEVYGAAEADFVPGEENLLTVTAVNQFADPVTREGEFFYKIRAVDGAGNTCEFADVKTVVEITEADVAALTMTAGSEHSGEGPDKAVDGNSGSLWHTNWDGTDRANMWIDMKFPEPTAINTFGYLPRNNSSQNGMIKQFRLTYSTDNGKTYQTLTEGEWNLDTVWKYVEFDEIEVTNIRLYALTSVGNYASAAEIKAWRQVEISEIAAREDAVTVTEGKSENILVDIYPTNLNDPSNLTWTSSDESVATVDEAGRVTGVAVGTATVTAAIGELTATVEVTVVPAKHEDECLAKDFSDVNLDAWYHKPIDFVLANGMMTGDKEGTFRPDVNISRAQVAQILYNMAEDKTYEASKTFSDVKDGQWFYDAVMWAAANGFVLGDDGADTFRPDAPITRQELVVIIWRYMGKQAPASAELTFADAAEAESWAVEAIAWASENEFVKGLGDNKFAPKANASRAQMTQILMNIFG